MKFFSSVSASMALTLVLAVNPASAIAADMTQQRMENIIISMSDSSEGGNGYLPFVYQDVQMALISDTSHDRMRIIAPIIQYNQLDTEHIDAMMVSNFHLALDARYAVSEGILYAAYIHPLSSLNKRQLRSAVRQVASLSISFGSEYSSGELTYRDDLDVVDTDEENQETSY